MSNILDKINGPNDLKNLSMPELEELAGETRSLIIETVSKTGGHLAANLGTVELTIALLKVFDPPTDKIIWDVSHQTYAYKILTGRRDRFSTLRQPGGLSGFLKRDESKYDAFGAGHSGTALSAALGMAVARDRRGADSSVVAVIGDGSVGCGISLEALNNVASATDRVIVVLNDNEMSISYNVGATARYLGRLLANPRYNRWKGSMEHAAKGLGLGWLRRVYYRIEESVKSLFLRNVIFEEFGLRYIGPIEGHDLHALCDALSIARDYKRSIVVHVATKKGKGYQPAEANPERWHGTSGFDVATGRSLKTGGMPTWSEVFGTALERLAEGDERVVAITAAMQSGTGLTGFAKKFPKRFFDVGICEEHAVVFAAGLSACGIRPFFAVYSTFLQRAIDCIIHDVCLQELPVVFCVDRAGIVGDDGPTHHGVFDIALLRSVPNLIIAQPRNETELGNMLSSALTWGKPTVIRYPRGPGPGQPLSDPFKALKPGRAEVVENIGAPGSAGKGSGECADGVWIWALGDMVQLGCDVASLLREKGLRVGVVNARFVRPLDTKLLEEHSKTGDVVVTIENGVVTGGFGAGVEEWLVSAHYHGAFMKFGWPDQFVPQGTTPGLMAKFGLTREAVADRVCSELARRSHGAGHAHDRHTQ